MLLIYNILQVIALLVLSPLLVAVVYLKPKYRGRVGRRFGLGLQTGPAWIKKKKVWIHALSGGEAASARALVLELAKKKSDIFVIFSTTTCGGEEIGLSMADHIDLFVPFPFDLYWVVVSFVKQLRPDLFILIETDFWPNFLSVLKKNKIPSLLVNGRMKEKSFKRYLWARPFFKRLFDSFSYISMQTKRDAEKIIKLGAAPGKVISFGNLKYDIGLAPLDTVDLDRERSQFGIPARCSVIVAGSTHPGEEEIILSAFMATGRVEDTFLVLAPRDVSRGDQVQGIVERFGLAARKRSESAEEAEPQVLILNTMGELNKVYRHADIAFVGGSMVDEGGHNPLEPAVFGKPILYGRYMSDFSEICLALEAEKAAIMVNNEQELSLAFIRLLIDKAACRRIGCQGAGLVREHAGAAKRCLRVIHCLLYGEKNYDFS